jgi:hypothetical protein
MISMNEAVARGLAKLRHDPWEPWSHIEIRVIPGGGHGPWVKVRSGHGIPDSAGAKDGAFEESILFSEFDWDSQEWERWEPPDEAPA